MKLFFCVREEIRTLTISRHPLKVVRLPVSPPGHLSAAKLKFLFKKTEGK